MLSTLTIIMQLIATSQAFMRNVYFQPDYGVMLERIGDVYTHYGYNYIPITYSVPMNFPKVTSTYSLLDEVNCNVEERINFSLNMINRRMEKYLDIKGVISIVKDTDDMKNASSREKRFIPFALAGASFSSLGLGIWNRYDISNIKDKIETFELNDKIIDSKLRTLADTSTTIINSVNKIHHVVGDSIKVLTNLTSEYGCLKTITDPEYIGYHDFIYSIPEDFMSALDSALLGHITPHNLPIPDIKKIIQHYSEFYDSPYNVNPYLIYQLGTFLFHSVRSYPLRITGLIVLPHIKNHGVGSFYSVGTTNWINSDKMYQIRTSPIVASSGDSNIFWTPKAEECIINAFYMVCPVHIMETNAERCVSGIFSLGTIQECEIDVKDYSLGSSLFIQMRSGLLVGAGNDTAITTDQIGMNKQKIKLKPVAQFLTPSIGRFAMYNNSIYTIGLHKDSVNITIIMQNITIPTNLKINQYVSIPNWSDLRTMNFRESDNNVPYFHLYTWISITIIAITFGVVCYLGYGKLKLLFKAARDLYKRQEDYMSIDKVTHD